MEISLYELMDVLQKISTPKKNQKQKHTDQENQAEKVSIASEYDLPEKETGNQDNSDGTNLK